MNASAETKRNRITRETMLPLAIVLALLGAAGFVINTNAVAEQNRREVMALKRKWEDALSRGMIVPPEQKREVMEINRRLIEEKFDGLRKQLEDIRRRLDAIEKKIEQR